MSVSVNDESLNPPGKLIRLREPYPSDAPLIVEWRNASRKFFFGEDPITLADHRQFMQRRDGFYFIIERIEDGKPVGVIALYNVSYRHKRAEYGRFLIAPEERRKGYGEEALRLLLRFAFGELGLFKVYGDILSNNHAAIRLDRKIGFFKEALFPKHVLKDGKRHNVMRMAIFQ